MNNERQAALEAQGWTFQQRNAQREWVRYHSNTSRRFGRVMAWAEAEQRNGPPPTLAQASA